ncbi:MAG: potassium/hydrogen antiporter [Gaiellaceae bacterium]|nr:potassium/hydrogen antiporter [Gaiellaceae bacterium]
MSEITHFGLVILIVAAIVALAVLSHKVSEQVPIPSPAIFLLAAAITAHAWPSLGRQLSVLDVERLAVVALALILFDGGMRVGWTRFRAAAIPISVLGVFGTLATAGLVALAGRYLFSFSWTGAGMLGAALSPTDPAVMFSVLGKREVGGRTGTILEGESGVNDPIGIALMIGMIDFVTHSGSTFWVVVREFALELSIGLAVGVAGAWLVLQSLRRIHLANPALYPLRSLAAAGVIYGAAAVAHGSGFLAVFVAGILIGDAEFPGRRDVERFHTSLASLAEVVVFIGLGLTVHRVDLAPVWTDAILIALILAFLARPLGIAPFLVPLHLRRGERVFVMWSGLKGAVPILLAAFALLEQVPGSERIYGIVFVVVAFSVIFQGSTVPLVARRLGIPMRVVHEGEP